MKFTRILSLLLALLMLAGCGSAPADTTAGADEQTNLLDADSGADTGESEPAELPPPSDE